MKVNYAMHSWFPVIYFVDYADTQLEVTDEFYKEYKEIFDKFIDMQKRLRTMTNIYFKDIKNDQIIKTRPAD